MFFLYLSIYLIGKKTTKNNLALKENMRKKKCGWELRSFHLIWERDYVYLYCHYIYIFENNQFLNLFQFLFIYEGMLFFFNTFWCRIYALLTIGKNILFFFFIYIYSLQVIVCPTWEITLLLGRIARFKNPVYFSNGYSSLKKLLIYQIYINVYNVHIQCILCPVCNRPVCEPLCSVKNRTITIKYLFTKTKQKNVYF